MRIRILFRRRSLSGKSSEESALEDMFKVEVLPRTARAWLTEQDAEQDGIARLAECLRDQPLLPAHPDDPEGLRSFDDIEELDKRYPLALCTLCLQEMQMACYARGKISFEQV